MAVPLELFRELLDPGPLHVDNGALASAVLHDKVSRTGEFATRELPHNFSLGKNLHHAGLGHLVTQAAHRVVQAVAEPLQIGPSPWRPQDRALLIDKHTEGFSEPDIEFRFRHHQRGGMKEILFDQSVSEIAQHPEVAAHADDP